MAQQGIPVQVRSDPVTVKQRHFVSPLGNREGEKPMKQARRPACREEGSPAADRARLQGVRRITLFSARRKSDFCVKKTPG